MWFYIKVILSIIFTIFLIFYLMDLIRNHKMMASFMKNSSNTWVKFLEFVFWLTIFLAIIAWLPD